MVGWALTGSIDFPFWDTNPVGGLRMFESWRQTRTFLKFWSAWTGSRLDVSIRQMGRFCFQGDNLSHFTPTIWWRIIIFPSHKNPGKLPMFPYLSPWKNRSPTKPWFLDVSGCYILGDLGAMGFKIPRGPSHWGAKHSSRVGGVGDGLYHRIAGSLQFYRSKLKHDGTTFFSNRLIIGVPNFEPYPDRCFVETNPLTPNLGLQISSSLGWWPSSWE